MPCEVGESRKTFLGFLDSCCNVQIHMIELIESIVIVDSLKLGAGTSRLGLYDSHGNITLMPILIGFCLQWGLFSALSVQVCKSTTCALSASISNHYNILFRSLLLGVVE